MNNQKKSPQFFDKKKQDKLFDIFYAQFSEQMKEDNCFLLTTVGQKITAILRENGFPNAKLPIFRACPNHFICGYDSTKETATGPAAAVAIKGYPTPARFVPTKAAAVSPVTLSEKLKAHFPYNEVPMRDVEEYLKQLGIVYEDVQAYLSENVPDMKQKALSMGEGYPYEPFLIVNPPREIPAEIRNRVIWIAKTKFGNKHIVENADIGTELRKAGVYFRNYNYLHLTSFIRYFKDIFSIISMKTGEKNNSRISVRILHQNLSRMPLPEIDITVFETQQQNKTKKPNTKKVLPENDFFRNSIFTAYENGAYESLRENIYISYGMQHLDDIEVWSLYINAFLKSFHYPDISEYTLNPWEKAAMIPDTEQLKEYCQDLEQLKDWGFTAEDLDHLDDMMRRNAQPATTVSALASRLMHTLPNASLLPEILNFIGLTQSEKSVRETAMRNLSLEYLKKAEDEKLLTLWETFSQSLSPKIVNRIFSNLFQDGKTAIILQLQHILPTEISSHSQVMIYLTMAKFMESSQPAGDSNTLIAELSTYSFDDQIIYLSDLYALLLTNENYSAVCMLSGEILLHLHKRVSQKVLYGLWALMTPHEQNLIAYLEKECTPDTVSLCAFWEFLAQKQETPNLWEEKREQIISEYISQIESAPSLEEKLALTETALNIFQNEKRFIAVHIQLLEEKYPVSTSDEPYKEILSELHEKRNALAIISLAESGKADRYKTEHWCQKILISAYRQQSLLLTAIVLGADTLRNMNTEHSKYFVYANKLSEDLYDYFYIEGKNERPEDLPPFALLRHVKNLIKNPDTNQYRHAMVIVKLLLWAEKPLNAAFIYALCMASSTISADLKETLSGMEEELKQALPNLTHLSLSRLEDVLNTVLTTLPIEDINLCLSYGRAILDLDRFEKDINFYKAEHKFWREDYSLPKALIAANNYGESWRIYGNEYQDMSKLSYVADFMCIYQFQNFGPSLSRCVYAMNQSKPEGLPDNLMELNYALLCKNYSIPSYWNAFCAYVSRKKAFESCNEELVKRYLSYTDQHPKYQQLTTELLIQFKNPDIFLGRYLQEDGTVNEAAVEKIEHSNFIHLIFCYIKYLREENALFPPYTDSITTLLNYVKQGASSASEKTVVLWLEEYVELHLKEAAAPDYFLVSDLLLRAYPRTEHLIFTNRDDKLPYEKYYNLLDRWLEINPSHANALSIYYFHIDQPTLQDEATRRIQFRYLSNALTKMYESKIQSEKNRGSLLRTCKSILTMYFLNNFGTETNIPYPPAHFVGMFENTLTSLQEKAQISQLATALTNLWEANLPHYLRDYLILCGMTNYWDVFLLDLLNTTMDLTVFSCDAVQQYIGISAYSALNRRLFQMLIYAKIALWNERASTNEQIFINNDDYPTFRKMAQNGQIDTPYFSKLSVISTLAGKNMQPLFETISKIDGDTEKSCLTQAYTVIQEKACHITLPLLMQTENPHDAVIQMFILLQYPDTLTDALEHFIKEQALPLEEPLLAFLNHPLLEEAIGSFYKAYLVTLFYHTLNRFDEASFTLPSEEICPEECMVKYNNLKNAVLNRTLLSDTTNFTSVSNLLKLSFMEPAAPSALENFNDLLISFDSGNLANNEKSQILLARKLYHYILTGETHPEYERFVMRWGFLELAVCQNYEQSLRILLELLNHIHLITAHSDFENEFLEAFSDIFLSLSEQVILSKFDSIGQIGTLLGDAYKNPLITNITQLLGPVAQSYQAPHKNFHEELSKAIEEAMLLRAAHPGNQLADKCYDILLDCKTQLESRGRLQLAVLNEENYINGSLFYTVTNTGSHAVEELLITVSILKNGEKLLRFFKEVPQLNKGQTYTEEIEIAKFFEQFPPEEKIPVHIDVVYNCMEHSALTLHMEHTLLSKPEEYEYFHRVYPYTPIDRTELFNLYNTVKNRNFVMLYGTNGTGKTSLLTMLKNQLTKDNTTTSKTFTITLTNNTENRSATEIIRDIMTSFCYCESSTTNTESVYNQLRSSLEYAVSQEEINEKAKDFILSNYREYISCSMNETSFVFSNFINQLKNLNNKFKEFKLHTGFDFKFCLLWDAFETVISSNQVSPEEMNFKTLIDTFKNEEAQIRIVFTGSNKLLEVAEVKNDADPWNIMFRDISGETSIKIGNLHKKDFTRIIADKNLLNGGEIHFSDAALDYLYQYTNGHISYSKMFVNQALDTLNERRVNRRCIYPSDIKIFDFHKKKAENEQRVAKNLTAQIFQDIQNDYDVINVGKTLAEIASDGNAPVSSAELKKTVLSSFHNIGEKQYNRAIEILKARDFITEEQDKYQKANYRFNSVLYLNHFLSREAVTQQPDEEMSLEELIEKIQSRNYNWKEIDEINKLKGEKQEVNVHIERQYNDHATDQSVGMQNNIQVNAQSIATTFNSILTADTKDLPELFSSLPMLSAFLPDGKQEQLTLLCNQLEEQTSRTVDPFDISGTEQLKQEQSQVEAQIATIVEPAVTEMHNTYKNAVVMAEDVGHFSVWETLGLHSQGEYQLLCSKLEPEFVADLYFAAKLDYLFKNMEDETITQKNTDFSPVSIMYCKLIEKMLKHYHTDIYADKLQESSTQNTIKNAQTQQEQLVLFGDLAKGTTLTDYEQKMVRQRIMIGAFLWPINPRFDNTKNRIELAGGNPDVAEKWNLHGHALNDISQTRNDSAHGSTEKRITSKRLEKLKCWLFERKELANLVELSLIHKEGFESYLKKQKEEDELLKVWNSDRS